MKRSILIVDDDEDQRRVLELLLKHFGHEVITAAEGTAALEKVRSDKPDLILLDINMPGLNGFEVCKRIKANPATPPSIAHLRPTVCGSCSQTLEYHHSLSR